MLDLPARIPRHRFSRRLVLPVMALALAGSLVQATRVRPLNLEEMTGRAERIFAGRCVDAQVAHDASLGLDVTTLTFEVTRAVKGGLGDQVTVKVLGRGAGIVGMPRFRPGEEVVLFLYGESALGLSSPVGLGQGKFSVFEDKLGRRRAVNSHGNKTLFRGLGPAASQWKGRNSIPPDQLLDLVESLVSPATGDVQRRTPHRRGEGRTRGPGR